MSKHTKVVVAMSGGVDSSVAAAILVEQGYDVIGMMLRLWSEPGRETHNRCCTPAAMAMARKVAAQLEIPFYAVDAKNIFHEIVVNNFIFGYTQGITPNPCLSCNRQIRWEFLFNHALGMGAEYMVTGHYARLVRNPGQPVKLFRAKNIKKDQSYVLSFLTQEKLQHTMLPLGEYSKQEVRDLAKSYNLPVAETKDSQDLCFLAGSDYASFLERNAADTINPGVILSTSGEVIGKHKGLAFYTIGQRKGLGLKTLLAHYVLEKDVERNALIVGGQNELGKDELIAGNVNWVNGNPASEPFRAQIKIRYTSKLSWGNVSILDSGMVKITFDELQRDITPGQAAVFYVNDEVIGGGVIVNPQITIQNNNKAIKFEAAR